MNTRIGVKIRARCSGLSWNVVVLLLALPLSAAAEQVNYSFNTAIASVRPTASGFPGALSGVAVGDSVIGVLSYSTNSPSTPNIFPGDFGLATVYALQNFSLSLQIGSVTLDSWSGSPNAFVWNNKLLGDGLLFVNTTGPNQAQFQIGNLLLPPNIFADESLPTVSVGGSFVVSVGAPGSVDVWVQTAAFNGLAPAPIPLPAPLPLLVAGVALLAARGAKTLRCELR